MDHRLLTQLTLRAANQYGLITLDQLRTLGVTRRQLADLVAAGWLHLLAPRVYGVAGAPASLERRTQLGLLHLGDGAVVSYEAAARLHRFDRHLADAVEFTVPRSRRHMRGAFQVHSTTDLPAIDRVRVAGFPRTSATRTIIDLARARIPSVRLEAAIDSAVRTGASSPLVLTRRLDDLRGPGRWGARRLDQLLLESGGHTLLERRFLALMRRAGLPAPTPQVVHGQGARTVARVDFLFESDGVVVEVSGRKGHASDADRARDAQRRNELQDLGRRVYEYTFAQVTGDPEFVIRTMRDRLTPPTSPFRADGRAER